MRFFRLAPLAPLALIAACVSAPAPPPPPAAPTPTPTPAPTPPPAPSYSNWEDAPQTPGDWTYAAGAATFGTPGQPHLVMRCVSASATVEIAAPDASADLMTIRTETATRTLQAAARQGQAVAALAARDPLLDAIAFSKGRFAVEAGARALYVPAWPEISRVIEDCR